MSPAILIALIAAVLALGLFVVLVMRWPRSPMTKVLRAGAKRTTRSLTAKAEEQAAASAEARDKRGLVSRIKARYVAEGIAPPSRVKVLLISVLVALVVIVLSTVAGWSPVAAVLVGALAWAAVLYVDFSRRRNRRKVMFDKELPDFLMTLSSSLKSGLTLDQAMSELTRDSETVLGQEFSQARREVALGKTWQDALLPLAERMKSVDVRNLIDGLALAQETGSSLTSILEAIAESCLERAQLKREIKTLTAEGMMSAYVIIALPFIIFLFLLLTQPSYVAVLWQPGLGMGIGIAAVVMIALGWVWLRRTIAAGSK